MIALLEVWLTTVVLALGCDSVAPADTTLKPEGWLAPKVEFDSRTGTRAVEARRRRRDLRAVLSWIEDPMPFKTICRLQFHEIFFKTELLAQTTSAMTVVPHHRPRPSKP